MSDGRHGIRQAARDYSGRATSCLSRQSLRRGLDLEKIERLVSDDPEDRHKARLANAA
jgi:hypothetical protein